MYNFKTKYKSCLAATDELQFVKQNADSPNPFKENAPKEKKANYNISDRAAVGSNKYLYVNQEQFSGKGVDISKQIYNDQNLNTTDAFTSIGKINNWSKRRVLKIDGIIYDLIS
tara:strand:+ start:292 stop:633 length:342 start_codon:yes stop_codon:yes gene_type:complete